MIKNKKTNRGKLVKVKGFAIITKDGEHTDQFSTIMSRNLIKFYNSSKDYRVIECVISYKLK